MIISNMLKEMSHMISFNVVFIRKGRDYSYSKVNKLILIFKGSIYGSIYSMYVCSIYFDPLIMLECTMFIFVAHPAHQFRVHHIWLSFM